MILLAAISQKVVNTTPARPDLDNHKASTAVVCTSEVDSPLIVGDIKTLDRVACFDLGRGGDGAGK